MEIIIAPRSVDLFATSETTTITKEDTDITESFRFRIGTTF